MQQERRTPLHELGKAYSFADRAELGLEHAALVEASRELLERVLRAILLDVLDVDVAHHMLPNVVAYDLRRSPLSPTQKLITITAKLSKLGIY